MKKDNSVLSNQAGGLKRKLSNRSSSRKQSARGKRKASVEYARLLSKTVLPIAAEADYDSVDSDNYETDSD